MQPCFEQNVYQATLSAHRPCPAQANQPATQIPFLLFLPVFPLTLAEMELLLQQPTADLAAMAEVAKRDASLAAQLLLLANSDREESDRFYRLEDCLVQLGTGVLQGLVQQMPPLILSDLQYGALLHHSLLTARTAEAIALQVPGVDPEKAYLAGLLHLFPELVSLRGRVLDSPPAIVSESGHWSLPAFTWEVIHWFKHPFAVSGQGNRLCEVVLAACDWATQSEVPAWPSSPQRVSGYQAHRLLTRT